jgi:hypothetical protein
MAGINDQFASRRAGAVLHVTGTFAAAGANVLIAAPAAGISIYVTAFVIQNEAATAQTMRLMAAAVAAWRCFAQNQGDGLAMVFPPGREWEIGSAAALNLDLAAATVCGYSIAYFTAPI